MEHFMTTYRKDYQWPVALKADERKMMMMQQEKLNLNLEHAGQCHQGHPKAIVQETNIPAESGTTEYNRPPNAYLSELYKKYPYLNKVMKFTNTDDMAKRIMSEKYKSTYQVEYNKIDVVKEGDTGQTEEVQKTGVCLPEGLPPPKCSCAQELAFTPCQCAKEIPVRRIAWKPAPVSKMPQVPREKKSKKSEEESEGLPKPKGHGGSKTLKPFTTEYKETISKVGSLIIKSKLLHKETIEANEDGDVNGKKKRI